MIYRQIVLAGAIVTGVAVHGADAQERWRGPMEVSR